MTNDNAQPDFDALQSHLDALAGAKDQWARTTLDERIAILESIKDALMGVAGDWARQAASAKGLVPGSPLEGEEWMSGPYALMGACNGLIETLSKMNGKSFLQDIPLRTLPNGQLAARVTPHTIWDRLLLSGVSAEVWMQEGVTRDNLAAHTATAYDTPAEQRQGKVSLVLGAGNIAAIAPLDVFQKLFLEHQVVILKM
ncbi:MAG: aldehyde dehydrogenase family protein, partial [Pseudomonadota bacterium]